MNLNKRIFFAVILLCLVPFTLFAANSAGNDFIIRNIQVVGLDGISTGTVLNYAPVKVGEEMTPAKAAETLRALYSTGFFQNVELDRSGNTLVIEVVERATIGDISFSGNHDITNEQIQGVLTQLELLKGHIFQRSSLDSFTTQLEQEYNNRGKYNASIETHVKRLSDHRVSIKIEISEGRAARIKEINIIGNHAFSDSTLEKQFSFTTVGLFSYFSGKDQYTKEGMNASTEALRSYYMDRGYIRFRVDSTQVLLSPDKKYVYVDIKIHEGKKYRFSGFAIEGKKLVLTDKDLSEKVLFKKGEPFSRELVAKSAKAMSDAYASIGYGFPSIAPNPVINDEDKTVFINFDVHPGRHVYVRRINFVGNTKTGDYVLRHVIKQNEGGLLTLGNIQESERQLRMLGYLKNIDVKTVKVPDTNDQVDMNVHVEEAPSAEASVSLGYGTNGPELNAGIDQHNLFGTGKDLGVHFTTSYYSTSYMVNYYDPFYTDSGIGRGISAYYTHIDPSSLDLANYTSDRLGGKVNYNIPLNNNTTAQAGYGFQNVSINSLGDPVVSQVKSFVDANGDTFNEIQVFTGLTKNTYDQLFFPTQGYKEQVSLQGNAPATPSSLSYYKASYSVRGYQPLFKGFIFTASGNLGYGDTFNNQGLPIYDNYFAGGIAQPGEVRGFETYSLGPKDSNNNSLGGNFLATGMAGIILPAPLSQSSFRTTAFMDFGNVYSYNLPTDQQGTPSGPLRYSAGLSLDWRSPMGPLTFSIATPLNEQPGDDTSLFQFSAMATL